MTDTRLPSRWLLEPTMEQLSDRAWRTFTGSLMWSNEAGTDGFMPRRSLRLFHPEGVDSATLDELLQSGLWVSEGSDLRVPDWEKKGQELRETVEARREGNRERQRMSRASKKKHKEVTVTRDVTRDVTDVEEDRTGKDRRGQDEVLSQSSKPNFRSVDSLQEADTTGDGYVSDGREFWPPGSSMFGGAA